jgi:hypothetical protein
MKQELEQKLYEKYPKLFVQKDLPVSLTCMCYGICVGDGWYDILDTLCWSIQNHIDRQQKNNPDYPQVEFSQIKEKFGGLRVYTDGNDETVHALIGLAESMADRTCEGCGKRGKNKSWGGWYVTYCDSCAAAYKKKTGKEEDKEDEEG